MSIPATEHSVMTCWPSEREAIANMIDHFGGGLFACVMDSYDYASVRVPHFAFVGSPREVPVYTRKSKSARTGH